MNIGFGRAGEQLLEQLKRALGFRGDTREQHGRVDDHRGWQAAEDEDTQILPELDPALRRRLALEHEGPAPLRRVHLPKVIRWTTTPGARRNRAGDYYLRVPLPGGVRTITPTSKGWWVPVRMRPEDHPVQGTQLQPLRGPQPMAMPGQPRPPSRSPQAPPTGTSAPEPRGSRAAPPATPSAPAAPREDRSWWAWLTGLGQNRRRGAR